MSNKVTPKTETYDITKGEQPIPGITLTGVNRATVFTVDNVTTMSLKDYNKWYRRAWRYLRRIF